MENMQMGGKNVCVCKHHKVVPASIMLIGLTFLLGSFGILTMGAVDIIWPILLIVIGLVKMKGEGCKCC